VKVPAGGVDCSLLFSPQQVTLPPVLSAQVWLDPGAICKKVPLGTVDCPK
jgi:hypothetical protein